MSTESPAADLQQKYRQFLDLLPLTVALAGRHDPALSRLRVHDAPRLSPPPAAPA